MAWWLGTLALAVLAVNVLAWLSIRDINRWACETVKRVQSLERDRRAALRRERYYLARDAEAAGEEPPKDAHPKSQCYWEWEQPWKKLRRFDADHPEVAKEF